MQLKKLQYFGFIPLFIVVYLLYLIVGDGFNTDLDRLDVVSIATFENYNVNKLVTGYHLSFLGGMLCAGLLVVFFALLYDKSVRFRTMTDFLNPLSAVGVLMVFFAFTSLQTTVGVNFLIAVAVGYVFYNLVFQAKTIVSKNDNLFLALSALALAMSFLVRELLLIFNFTSLLNITLIWLIIFAAITTVFKYSFAKSVISSQRIFYICRPLFFLPLLSVLKDEIYLILNQRGIEIFSPVGWYFIGIFIIVLSVFLLWLSKNRVITIKRDLYIFIFPVLLTGLAAISHYAPFLNSIEEFFELANLVNPVFLTVTEKAIPFVDYLNSHGLSEIWFSGIYVLLNGFSGTIDFILYEFLFLIICYLISYYFLMQVFGKKPILFFFVLFFPYLWYLFPKSFILAICLLFLLYRFIQQPSSRNLLYVCLLTMLTVLWRFDLGLPCVLITIVFLVGYLISNYSKQLFFNYMKIGGVLLSLILCVGTIFYLRSPEQFISNIFQALDYLSYNQAHAYTEIKSSNLKANFYHQTLFPIVAGVMFVFVLLMKKTKQIAAKDNFIWFSILFFLSVYFINFQRGLVRHSLYEGWDGFTSVFFYISAGLFLILLLSQKMMRFRIAAFLLFTTVLIYVVRYPGVQNAQDLFVPLQSAFMNMEKNGKLPAKTARVVDAEEFAEKHYNDFKQFFDDNFDKDDTFLDFSNTPMFYFYLQRKVPSYFCQYMQNTVSEFLQRENLKLLQTKNIPVVLFSNYPPNWFDYADGVPNTLRFNIICRHIYENYVPYTVLNKHAVWIKKGITLKNQSDDTSLSFAYEPQNYYLKKYPYLLGKYGNFSAEKFDFTTIKNREKLPVPYVTSFENSWIFLKINAVPHNAKAKITYYKDNTLMGNIEFEVLFENENQYYVIPINAQYNWYCGMADEVLINLTNVSSDVTIDVSFIQQ